ncbi:hypothetical protein [Lysinibacillus sp. LZ02]|uniref:hypothetical protein n=1 Tax=Lysinibacillus sp. LZ02 TaxID=3420668 RepID=UPI003D36D965
MNKRWIIVLAVMFIIGLGTVTLYYREPTPFLTTEEIVEVLNKQGINRTVKVLDVLEAETSYRFVPFTTEDGRSGMSYWAFKLSGWKLVGYEWNGQLKIWKLRANAPTSYYFIWHFAPQEEATQMNILFLQDRYYSISGDNNQFYTPRIQLQMNIDLTENLYGLQPIPENWLSIISAMTPIQQDSLFSSILGTPSSYYFGMQTVDAQGQEVYLETGAGSQSYWLEGADFYVDHVMNIYEEQLEKP